MKEVTGQDLGVLWTEVGGAVLGEVDDLQAESRAEDKAVKSNVLLLCKKWFSQLMVGT